MTDARAKGLPLTGAPQGGLWPAFGFEDLAHVDRTVVAAHVPGVFTLVLVTLPCLRLCAFPIGRHSSRRALDPNGR